MRLAATKLRPRLATCTRTHRLAAGAKPRAHPCVLVKKQDGRLQSSPLAHRSCNGCCYTCLKRGRVLPGLTLLLTLVARMTLSRQPRACTHSRAEPA